MKNLFLKRAVHFLRRFVPLHPKQGRILVVATTALGDTLWATPALENLRKSFPHSFIGVLTSPIGMEILKHNPHVDQLFLLKEPVSRSFFSLWRELFRQKFDTVLVFHASQRLTLPLCALLGANRIVGTAGINKGLDALLTDPLPNHAQHEIVRRLKIVEAIGTQTVTEKLSLFLQPEEHLPRREKGPWIAIHPGSKDAFKRWPAEYFVKVGQALKDYRILITGNGSEKALMEEVARQIPGARIAETKTLREFAALLEQMDLLISNDTGPVHLACALDRPVIAIYSSTHPALCGPHQATKAVSISRRATCDPCLKRKCRLPFCFLQIGPQEVTDAALKILEKGV